MLADQVHTAGLRPEVSGFLDEPHVGADAAIAEIRIHDRIPMEVDLATRS